jgi:hypothetical protein
MCIAVQEEGFFDPQVASMAFQIDSMLPATQQQEQQPAPARCYLACDSLCAMITATTAGMRKDRPGDPSVSSTVFSANQTKVGGGSSVTHMTHLSNYVLKSIFL